MRILIPMLLIFVSTAHAAGMDQYLNIYSDIKADLTVKNDDPIIFERLQTTNYKSLEDGRELTNEEEQSFIESNSIEAVNITNTDFFGAQNDNKKRFQKEREWLTFERLLKRQLAQEPLLTDEEESNSPFDLIADLNIIDQLYFQDKDKRLNPGFNNPNSSFSEASEDWQIGDPRASGNADSTIITNSSPSPVFDREEKSIVGAIEDIMEDQQLLQSKPLNCEYATSKFFDTGQCIANTADTIELTNSTFKSPGVFGDTPEVLSVVDTLLGPQVLPILKLIAHSHGKDFYRTLDTQVGASRSTQIQQSFRASQMGQRVNALFRGVSAYNQQTKKYHFDRVLEHLSLQLVSLKDQSLQLEETFVKFYDKPDR